jgi:peptidyl-tRNA hydrolase, PTH2 family
MGDPYSVKQVIILRADLDMPPGKAASQAAHASIAWLSRRLAFRTDEEWPLLTWSVSALYSGPEVEWLSGSFTKIVLQASLEDMMHVYYEAQEAGLEVHLIVDEGRTVFDGIPTTTAVGIGPDRCDKIDLITGGLKLYE